MIGRWKADGAVIVCDSGADAGAIQRWYVDAVPLLETLMISANSLLRASRGEFIAAENLDETCTACTEVGNEWLVAHPCPHPELGRHLQGLLASFSELAATLGPLTSPIVHESA
jgi:hypothetical protein